MIPISSTQMKYMSMGMIGIWLILKLCIMFILHTNANRKHYTCHKNTKKTFASPNHGRQPKSTTLISRFQTINCVEFNCYANAVKVISHKLHMGQRSRQLLWSGRYWTSLGYGQRRSIHCTVFVYNSPAICQAMCTTGDKPISCPDHYKWITALTDRAFTSFGDWLE